jgi:hypothetical protein
MRWLGRIFAAIGRFFRGIWRFIIGDPNAFDADEALGEA